MKIHRASSTHRLRLSTAAALCIGVVVMVARVNADPAAPSPPAADQVPQSGSKDPGVAKAAREQELQAVRAEQKKAVEAEAKLRKDIEAIGEDRRKLNDDLIKTAARIRTLEEQVAGTEARLNTLENNERKLRLSLDARRGVLVKVLAVLQRMGRQPPPVILVTPQDALGSVRSAILLAAVLPQMQGEAQALSRDLGDLVRLRNTMAAERDAIARDLSTLSQDRQRMNLLVEERQKKQGETEKALGDEHQRAIALARQADNLKDLIAKLEKNITAAARAGDAAAQPQDPGSASGPVKDPGRLAPAIAFASAKGALRLPVSGVKIRDFGSPDGLGGTEKGLWIASRGAAQVTAPCDGWVVYAGPFRSYGQLLILNAGGGYHVLLAGMERISVDLGQFVLTGEPVAIMGGGPQSAAAVAIGSTQPVLYVEFRKDGTPVDPSPWWATTDSEKVRG